MDILSLFSFGANGWGVSLIKATGVTIMTGGLGFILGILIGVLATWARLQGSFLLRQIAHLYITIMRGVPALLVIYLIYFGGSMAVSSIASAFGNTGFIGLPPFTTGVITLAIISGAYSAEVLRGAYLAIQPGQFEAAHSIGMEKWRIAALITIPLTLRYALPTLGNVWQMVLKESALISVIGLVDLMRQSQIAAGSTSEPFAFYLAAGALYLAVSSVSGFAFKIGERWSMRGVRAH